MYLKFIIYYERNTLFLQARAELKANAIEHTPFN